MAWLVLILAFALAPAPASGMRLSLEIGQLDGPGWVLSGIRAEMDTTTAPRLGLRVSHLRLPPPVPPLEDLRLDCPGGRLGADGLACPELRMVLPGLGAVTGRLQLSRASGVDLELDPFPLAGGRVGLRLQGGPGGWRARLRAREVEAEALAALTQQWELLPRQWTLSGRVDLEGEIRGQGGNAGDLRGRLTWRRGAFSDPSGRLAGEGLELVLEGVARSVAGGWKGDLEADARGGGVYADPVFLDLDARPVDLRLRARGQGERLQVSGLHLHWGQDLILRGEGRWSGEVFPSGLQGRLDVERARFPAVYDALLQPFLRGTVLGDLETAGEVSARLDWRGGRPVRAAVTADGLFADDRLGRLGLYDADARLLWDARGGAPMSHLGFMGGHLYRLPMGMTRMALQLQPDGLHLPGEVRIPLLDGALRVHTLALRGLGTGDPQLALDASLMPVSMGQLAAHLGMPPFQGILSGSIPGVRYRDGVLSVGGRLVVRAFDGLAVVRDLSLREPFGRAPVLTGELALEGMDLAALTDAFEFGRIRGRLHGYARDLELVNWSPVHFDAALYTPLEGDFPRRISQQALDNLVDLGGGVGGALGGGFLGLFDTFGYRQLGLACRLEGAVCRMRGVAPGPEGRGYYIVQGAGLPRVDVIGHTREVAWRELLARLAAALERGAVRGEAPGPPQGPAASSGTNP
ncbi:hypothetical protein SAMN05421721_101209 [Ectothiorhodospira mobilis]|uniref:Dicarboxylate transport n=1 Tax=Ectothiorhodospira mobilis TaxID=195064 RepID=A0A1I4PE65_ECTMO|nr:hypothetical protein [Ectothiorhodospira mobilis]SFM25999.1 hypothetical protein SAMN05421721_101209 [Ectothiorhodospira mobilis]